MHDRIRPQATQDRRFVFQSLVLNSANATERCDIDNAEWA